MLERFFWVKGDPGRLVVGEYQPELVLLSLLIAVVLSCIAMQVLGIAQASQDQCSRRLAIATASLALGVGVWAMHFIGMLAFRLATPIHYDFFLTAASVLPAILASVVALHLLARTRVDGWQLFAAACLVGGGIGVMHYSGMAAMQMVPKLRFDPFWFVASIVLSVGLAWSALWLRCRAQEADWLGPRGVVLASGLALAAAVAAMHYFAMQAVRFVGEGGGGRVQSLDTSLIVSVALLSVVFGAAVLAGNLLLRFRSLYQQLRLSELRRTAIFDTAADGIITIERDGCIADANPSAVRMFGWEREDLIGRNVRMLMPEPLRARHDAYLAAYRGGRAVPEVSPGYESSALRKDGTMFPIRLVVGELKLDKGRMLVGFVSDISEQKRIEHMLEQQAFHDALTELPNRRQLFAVLPMALARADRCGKLLALLFLDLDDFKRINDDFGHDAGDEVLQQVAGRLQLVARRADLIVRLAGDEFVVVLEGLENKQEAVHVAEKLRETVEGPLQFGGGCVDIRLSLGIAFYRPESGLQAEELLRRADMEMYIVKRGRKGRSDA